MADELTPIIERIQRHIRIDHGHWIWTGTRDAHGYALVRIHGLLHRAHRVMWQARHGELYPGEILRNRCGYAHCIAPDHWTPAWKKHRTQVY